MTRMRMTKTVNGKSVINDKIFNAEELAAVVKYLSKLPKKSHRLAYAGITEEHILYPWFYRHVFSKLCSLVDKPMRLLTGNLIHEDIPQKLHSDYYYKTLGEPYRAFLIPISVEHDTIRVAETHTIVFNESDTYVAPVNQEEKIWNRTNWKQTRTPKSNNALQYKAQHLSHIPDDDLECLTVENVIQWQLGSVLHWDETLLHCSDNFTNNGIQSKQAIVIHTYVL